MFNCNPVPRGTRNHLYEALLNGGLTSADSEVELDLEIALSGASAKVKPHDRLLNMAEDALKRRVT